MTILKSIYKHKTYGSHIKVYKEYADEKHKILDYKKYKKIGRPKKADYLYLTMPEIIERRQRTLCKLAGNVFNNSFKLK